jgi:hypothetical protein
MAVTQGDLGGPLLEPRTICGEPGPQIQYICIAGQVVRVHAACDTVWKQGRAGRPERIAMPM